MPPERRYDEAREAQEFHARKRVPPGESAIPVERYLSAARQMASMRRFSTSRGEWLPSQSVDPDVDRPRPLVGLRSETPEESLDSVFPSSWTPLGPGNIGGRTRALVIHPTTASTLYAAGVAGGVWKSTDSGASFSPIGDFLANLAVTTLVMAPDDPEVLYAGTGEGMFNGDAVRGAGVFKTTDGGAHWTQLSATGNSDFHYVQKLVVSTVDSNRLYAATRTGLFRSADGGDSWDNVLKPGLTGGCMDLSLRSVSGSDEVVASCGTFESSVISLNPDAGGSGSWTPVLGAGSPVPEPGMGRTSLARAPSDPSIVYALSASVESGSFSDGLYAVFRSTDGGATWSKRVDNTSSTKLNTTLLSNTVYAFMVECRFDTTNTFLNQGWYDNVIAVDPVDSDRVWVGGIDLYRSDDGGANWGLASHWWGSGGAYVHADQHALVFHPEYDGSTNRKMYVGNDGGLFLTTNARGATIAGNTAACDPSQGLSFSSLNHGYGVTQFYAGVPFPSGTSYFGGTQDNGTVNGTDASGPDSWSELLGGDGGAVAVHPSNTQILYAENTRLSIQKSTDGGGSFAVATNGITESSSNFLFIAPFVLDPANPNRLWTGGRRMWRTTDAAANWTAASSSLGPSGRLSAIAVANGDGNRVLAGLDNGRIHRTTSGLATTSGTAWLSVTPRAGYVSSLAFDPSNASVAYATYSSFDSSGNLGHVWKSTDGGASWTRVDGSGGNTIPDIPCHSIAIDPGNSLRLFLGTDLGVFVSLDGGASWAVENGGFANVPTESLVLNGSSLFAFTHGRGAWRVTVPSSSPTRISFLDAPTSVQEGKLAEVTVIRTGDLSRASSVDWITSNGSATAPADYTSSSGRVDFAAGVTSQTISIPTVQDRLVELPNESFLVKLSNPVAATFAPQTTTNVIVLDNEAELELSKPEYRQSEGKAGATIGVVRRGDLSQAVSVSYSTTPGSATASSDYTPVTGSVSFPAGAKAASFVVPLLDDSLIEGNETLTLSLSSPSPVGAAGLGARSSARLWIEDDEASLQFRRDVVTAVEDQGSVTLVVTRNGPVGTNASVTCATVAGGTATPGSDYVAVSSRLTFKGPARTRRCVIPIVNTSPGEGAETIRVALSDPSGPAVLSAPSQATVTLLEDAADAVGALGFEFPVWSSAESSGTASVDVLRTGGTVGSVSVHWAATTGSATVPGDLSGTTSGTLTFAAGETRKTITLGVASDSTVEGNELVNLTLSNPSAPATLGRSTAILWIVE